jgi:rhamnosyl/mannosyltransferase
MKILHVYKTFLNDTFGGVEQVIAQIAMASNACEFNHTVLSLAKNTTKANDNMFGIQNIRYKENINIASNAFSYDLFKQFGQVAAEYDLIHYHFPWPFADLLHSFWRIKKPTVLTYHSDIVRQKKILFFYRPLMNYFLNSVDRIVATSPNYMATSPVLKRFDWKTSVIPIGLNKDQYPLPDASREGYWEHRFGKRFFLFVGVLRYYKGLHILLDALQNTSFPVLLVGAGPIESELKARAKALNLRNVYFLGQLPEVD